MLNFILQLRNIGKSKLDATHLDPRPKRHLGRGMKPILFALFVAVLMVGCREQAQKIVVEGEVSRKIIPKLIIRPFLSELLSDFGLYFDFWIWVPG